MRTLSIFSLALVAASCTVTVPRQPPRLAISMKLNATATATATATTTAAATTTATGGATGGATVHTAGHVEVPVPPAPPPPPPVPVAIQGAEVVEFFGIPLEGAEDVVFVLDCSGSMDDLAQGAIAQVQVAPPPTDAPPAADAPPSPPDATAPAPVPTEPPPAPRAPRKIDIAQAELVDALRQLPAGTRMNVIFFNTDLDAFAPSLVPLQEAGREGLVAFVSEQVATGRTALVPAMRTAFLMNARRIVLLSDGLGNVGGDSSVLLRDAREAMRGSVRIDTIGLGRDQDAALLGALASESGGLYQPL